MYDKEILESIRSYLLRTEETIAVAESVTSGFLQAAFSTTPDGAKFFQGGITTYNLGQKYRHLQVNPIHAEACNCVSKKVAEQMAMNVSPLFSSDWGIGITGYASRVEEGNDELYAHYAIAFKGKMIEEHIIRASTEEGEETQLYFVSEVLKAFEKALKNRK